MKFFHISDLHIGKIVNGFSMLEDQKFVIKQILEKIDTEKPDAVIIAGDVYDKTTPNIDAVSLLDYFLTALLDKKVAVFCISGNHDSAERLEFGNQILRNNKIYIEGVFRGEMKKITVEDEYGKIHFHLLPFVRPSNVRNFYKEEKINSYEDAVRTIILSSEINKEERNILISHQFILPITGEIDRSDSETESLGGINSISSKILEDFDYVALGHIHRPQKVGKDYIRYGGSPLKYSFSEVNHKKAVTVVDIKEKGNCEISNFKLTPLYDMRKIKGPFKELISDEIVNGNNKYDYLHITLTDEEEIVDAIGKLRVYYPNIMELSFENSRTKYDGDLSNLNLIEKKSPMEIFNEFFKEQNGKELISSQEEIIIDYFNKDEE